MSASNRQVLIARVYKVLKNHYKPVRPPADRSVLEHLLYACCLEDAPFDAADEAFAKLQQVYFDWNEVRVTTVTELAETLSCLPEPPAAAGRLKRTLQSVFEAYYAFDLEPLTKQNLGKAVKELETVNGVTPFAVAYVSQHGLGGHAIACCRGVFGAFEELGIISSAEAAKRRVPGLERAISKAKGVEFASLLHQFGAEYFIAPRSGRVRAVVTEVGVTAKEEGRAEEEDKEQAAKRAEDVPAEPSATAAEEAEGAEGAERKERNEPPVTDPSAEPLSGRTRKPAATKRPGPPKSSKVEPDPEPAAQNPSAEYKKSTTKQLSRKKPR